MEGALCIFQSAILQTEIQFKKAKNDAKTAIFVIRKGDDHYRCILFDDGTETGPYQRMYKMREKLKKGKVSIKYKDGTFIDDLGKFIKDSKYIKYNSEEGFVDRSKLHKENPFKK